MRTTEPTRGTDSTRTTEPRRGTDPIRTRSGRSLDELGIEALRAGTLTAEDFRISRAQLDVQAAAAEAAGYRQLAANLRRAAELTALPNERVFAIYEMLRPGRATVAELRALVDELQRHDMPRVAAFIAEAADAYEARGIAKRN
jgi:propanediol dehydratase small subunit